jgi:hypothetical protein
MQNVELTATVGWQQRTGQNKIWKGEWKSYSYRIISGVDKSRAAKYFQWSICFAHPGNGTCLYNYELVARFLWAR